MARILIVDDMWSLRRLVRAYLGHGHTYRDAESGVEALSALPAFQPELVVSDVRMGDMDGLALCAEVRKRTGAPVILMSSQAQTPEALRAAGAAAFVKKPLDADELVAAVEAALRPQQG